MTTQMHDRLREALADRDTEPMYVLRELGLLPTEDLTAHDAKTTDVTPAAPIVHIDPQTLHRTDGATGVTGVYVQDTLISTESTPPYLRLPSFPEYFPYLIIYFMGRPAGRQFTATLDVQVYSSGGSIRIGATNNPTDTILSHSATGGARVKVPIVFTTTADGFASVILQRIGETGFDWHGVDLT